jgi:CHAT domain-containing protein/tetratricopeptide (TPR) repeat protein
LLLIPLRDTRPDGAKLAYDYARRLFEHGELTRCQREAEQDSRQFRISDPAWAVKSQLLEAEAMLIRGLDPDARHLLSALPGTLPPEAQIKRLTLEGAVFTRLQEFSAAEQRLQQAESLCKAADFASCGGVLRARGVLAIDQGQNSAARRFLLESLSFARSHHDRFLEATALLNLAVTALQSDRYDEATDWSKAARQVAQELGAADLEQAASGNLGYAYFDLGDHERALGLFLQTEKEAARIGSLRDELKWLENIGYVYQTDGDSARAAPIYQQALALAERLDLKQDVLIALEELAYAAIDAGKLEEADAILDRLTPLAEAGGNRTHEMSVILARGEIAVRRQRDQEAEKLLIAVEKDKASPTDMRLDAGRALAEMYERESRAAEAEAKYKATLSAFESARAELKNEDSRLPFLANGEPIYDSYIHFLASRGRTVEALEAADQSRARTLADGLGLSAGSPSFRPGRLHPGSVAQKAGATLLFYWLGEKESYLWAITPSRTNLFVLPAKQEIAARVVRYRQALLAAKDPQLEGNDDGRALYGMLVAPAAHLVRPGGPVVILADGVLSQLNFETLLAPGAGPDPDFVSSTHYWVEDAVLASAPSLSVLAATGSRRETGSKLLMLGNAVSPGADYPELPMAGLEMNLVEKHFAVADRTVFAGSEASPAVYLASKPQQFSYIHFVAHGVASRTDPLDSAIILSRAPAAEDNFKLYARDIIRHPISARLVTISACYGSGARFYAGEGLVGLSWSFLRAGADNVIGALWDVSDESTPRLMNLLYQGIEDGHSPSEALHAAKLNLLHAHGVFRKPFYWAPFQLYEGH